MTIGGSISQTVGGLVMAHLSTPSFLSNLEKHLSFVGTAQRSGLLLRIRQRAKEVVAEEADRLVVDAGSRGMLKLSAAVLASYELLREEVGDKNRTILLLQHVFTESTARMNSAASGFMLRRKGRQLDVVASFLEPLTKLYGESMSFEFERHEDEYLEMRVTRCFFRDFFDERGLQDVTTVLCAADAFWMKEIDPAAMGVRVERSAIMSLGDPCDIFRVYTCSDPLACNVDVLDTKGPGRGGL